MPTQKAGEWRTPALRATHVRALARPRALVRAERGGEWVLVHVGNAPAGGLPSRQRGAQQARIPAPRRLGHRARLPRLPGRRAGRLVRRRAARALRGPRADPRPRSSRREAGLAPEVLLREGGTPPQRRE